MLEVKINKKYKDRLFCLRFGSEECKEDMLSLYNALNGTEEGEAITELKLSYAFINESKGGFEWTATVYNLNRGKNDSLLKKCKPLSEYMELINRIRDNQKQGMDIKNAVDAESIEDFEKKARIKVLLM